RRQWRGHARHPSGAHRRARDWLEQRQRAPAHDLRRQLRAEDSQRARGRHLDPHRDSGARRLRAGDRVIMPSLRVLVADDEQLARDELCFLLGQDGEVEVVGQARDGVEALRMAGQLQPDLVFLDVQMPGLTGFEVARRIISAELAAQLVFVTAFDQYAVDAFTVNAVDYLLKPVDLPRLEQTLERARRRLASEQATKLPLGGVDLEKVIEAVQARQERRSQLAIRVGERFVLVQSEDVVHASLVDEAIMVVTNAVSGTSNYRTLDELQARLDPAVFWRVHRSHLVNITKIKEIVPWFSRNYILKMKDPKATEIPVSRSQTRRLRDHLQL